MQQNLLVTQDGSHTIGLPELNVTYHSLRGAIQESRHVFIEAGLKPLLNTRETITLFEMGFGTGLNALLTLMEAEEHRQKIYYETLEAYPLQDELVMQLNYCSRLQRPGLQQIFLSLHHSPWEKEISITPHFTLRKEYTELKHFSTSRPANLIYYDAFAPDDQPELWTEEILRQLFHILAPGGILVTYCSKGAVRRAMQAVGFTVEKLPGPAGKREIIRAKK